MQYAAASSSSWSVTNLSGAIQPGKYYLVQEAAGAGGSVSLPAPDATGGVNMSATAGKVALVNTTAALTGAGCPFGASVVDFVGFGSEKSCFEGAAAPAPSNTNAILRAGDGCTDGGNNSTDFAAGAPNPRNGGSPARNCGGAAARTETTNADSQTGTGGGEPTEAGVTKLQKETRAGLFVSEEPLPFLNVSYSLDGFSERRPRGGLRRWRRGAWAFGPRGTRGVRPRPRGAWP